MSTAKVRGSGKIQSAFMKLAASITDSDTTTIIIDLTKEEFSDLAEIAPVRSLFKNGY